MKKLCLLTLVATLAFSGCKKDDDKPSYNADATINGVKTTFTDLQFINVTSGQSTTYSITNYGMLDENDIYITLVNPIVGDNNFSYFNDIELEIGDKSYDSVDGEGKITLTKKDETILSGTFSGTFVDDEQNEIEITGNFSSKQGSLDL
jgi:PBP1b-binding outer membrane lipoprotein LpoB